MARIIIIPQADKNYDPSKFELSVKKLRDDGSYKFYKKFSPSNDLALDIDLRVGDIIDLTYEGITQIFNWKGADKTTTDPLTEEDLANDIILAISQGTFDSGISTSIIENDVDVNIKSFNQKEPLEIKLTPATGAPTRDQSFWEVINSHQLNFRHYRNFIDDVLTSFPPPRSAFHTSSGSNEAAGFKPSKEFGFRLYKDNDEKGADSRRLPFNRTEAYSLLKFATEKYVERVFNLKHFLHDEFDEAGKFELEDYLGKDKIIPYYDLVKSKIKEFFRKEDGEQTGFLRANADVTLIELIWNYWLEEGMVNQTMSAIARRFQNMKSGYKDPLLNFALDPLRPLNNILWGYIQDTQHRLSPTRRNYEYTSEYDLFVLSTMKPGFNPADRRSKFLQSFHRLIYEATEYFVQSDNTTIRPDGFKLLNALRDTHRILAEGANNQFGDLPTVARIETLIEQWILSRQEIREFLGGRVMVPYEEPWMDRVDSMKALQGWDNTSISFYRDLAVYGEKIILGIRYGNWTNITRRDHATNWADAFRDAIQRYVHSYYTVTGIDISAPNVNVNSNEKFLLPGVLIREKYLRERPMLRRY